jgi:antitoxin component YwqK of YwqJK toxin-antitoxin module
LPIRQQEYKSGVPDGVSFNSYAPGKKMREVHWKNGKPDGLMTLWYENGQKQFEASYKMGQYDGKVTYWNPKGQKTREFEFDNGKVLTKGVTADDVVLPEAPKEEAAKGGNGEKPDAAKNK